MAQERVYAAADTQVASFLEYLRELQESGEYQEGGDVRAVRSRKYRERQFQDRGEGGGGGGRGRGRNSFGDDFSSDFGAPDAIWD